MKKKKPKIKIMPRLNHETRGRKTFWDFTNLTEENTLFFKSEGDLIKTRNSIRNCARSKGIFVKVNIKDGGVYVSKK